jgi:hypothetical protein
LADVGVAVTEEYGGGVASGLLIYMATEHAKKIGELGNGLGASRRRPGKRQQAWEVRE